VTTDYERDQAADAWAHKYGRWIVFGCLPVIIIIYWGVSG
jgi:hypothetical protein